MTTLVKESKKVVEMTELEKLEAKIAQMKEDAKKAKEIEKKEKKKLAEKLKEQKLKAKETDAKDRVAKIKEALIAKGEEKKINMTLRIKEMAMQDMTIDDMVEETGWNRKSILDRIWLIEKSLGLR